MVQQDIETTQLLQDVLNSVNAAIWMKDTDHKYILVNQEFKDLFGIDSTAEVVGYTDSKFLPEDLATQFQANDRQAIEAGEPIEIEEKVQTDDGERIYLTRITPIYDGNDTIYATCGVASDITRQKQREVQLQRERERLEEFASVVSHDLRNPLNVAEGMLELAREEHDNEHLEAVARSQERMKNLIEDLLELARAGDMVSETEIIDFAEFVKSCWQNVDTADARVQINTTQTLRADRSRLQQLLENLFRNAVEHGDSSVTVTVGDLARGFYIEDDGDGIPEDERDDVFEAGYTTSEQGTGFGLNIIRQIVDAHGWEIRVTESSEGGARFEITGVEFVAA